MTVVGGTLTGIMTYRNVGITETFMGDWISSFAITALVMIPIGFVFMTLISKLVQFRMPNGKKIHQQLVMGLSMALIMEPVMAISTTANTIGFSDKTAFVIAWGQALIAALPFGLFMAVMMSLFLKPRLDKFMAS
tara:strand:+ start:350 stop:754 length:405 start_codon:yes stop_codon:yes gene_type:complete